MRLASSFGVRIAMTIKVNIPSRAINQLSAISPNAMKAYSEFKLGVTLPGIPTRADMPKLSEIKLYSMDFAWQGKNRDAILKDVYRAGDEKAHAALTGPFPVHSWATPPGPRAAL